jgi:hypothetical protein
MPLITLFTAMFQSHGLKMAQETCMRKEKLYVSTKISAVTKNEQKMTNYSVPQEYYIRCMVFGWWRS